MNIRYKVVGNATNILFPDTDFTDVLILTKNINEYRVEQDFLHASCGTNLSAAIREISRAGFGGLDELFGIPGSVGGMIFGNAGAYGKSMSDVIASARVYAPFRDEIKTVSAEQMKFSYRSSILKHSGEIALSAALRLSSETEERIRSALTAVLEKRHAAQPVGRSLGSIFKRRDGTPVSAIIDKLGMKGMRVGGAEISKKHAGFIVNVGGATARDVRELISIIKDRIRHEYGFVPEEEIEILN